MPIATTLKGVTRQTMSYDQMMNSEGFLYQQLRDHLDAEANRLQAAVEWAVAQTGMSIDELRDAGYSVIRHNNMSYFGIPKQPKTWLPFLSPNTETLASVRRGLDQAANGETRSLGSFAQYANDRYED